MVDCTSSMGYGLRSGNCTMAGNQTWRGLDRAWLSQAPRQSDFASKYTQERGRSVGMKDSIRCLADRYAAKLKNNTEARIAEMSGDER